MEISINREALLRAMTPLAPLFGRNGGLKFSADGDKLELVAGNKEVEMRTETLCGVSQGGAIVIGGRKLFDFVRLLPDGQGLQFSQDGDFSRVIASRANFKFANLPLDAYESYQHVGEKTILADFTLTHEAFRALMAPVLHAVGKNDARVFVNGVLFHFVGEELFVVSTNGHMLALNKCVHGGKVDAGERKFLIHGDAVAEMLKLAAAPEGKARFRFTDAAVRMDTAAASYKTRLLAAQFAAYEQVIPSHDKSVEANTEELLEAVVRASILSGKYRGVRLDVDQGQVLVSAHNEEQEEVSEHVGATTEINSARIAFNADYIASALKVINAEKVQIAMGGGESAVLIMDREQPDIRQVVMPLRI